MIVGFTIEWTSQARSQYDSLIAEPGIDKLFLLKAVTGRLHEEWLAGRRFDHPALVADDVRLLEVGTVGLVYAMHESERRVTLLAILGDTPE